MFLGAQGIDGKNLFLLPRPPLFQGAVFVDGDFSSALPPDQLLGYGREIVQEVPYEIHSYGRTGTKFGLYFANALDYNYYAHDTSLVWPTELIGIDTDNGNIRTGIIDIIVANRFVKLANFFSLDIRGETFFTLTQQHRSVVSGIETGIVYYLSDHVYLQETIDLHAGYMAGYIYHKLIGNTLIPSEIVELNEVRAYEAAKQANFDRLSLEEKIKYRDLFVQIFNFLYEYSQNPQRAGLDLVLVVDRVILSIYPEFKRQEQDEDISNLFRDLQIAVLNDVREQSINRFVNRINRHIGMEDIIRITYESVYNHSKHGLIAEYRRINPDTFPIIEQRQGHRDENIFRIKLDLAMMLYERFFPPNQGVVELNNAEEQILDPDLRARIENLRQRSEDINSLRSDVEDVRLFFSELEELERFEQRFLSEHRVPSNPVINRLSADLQYLEYEFERLQIMYTEDIRQETLSALSSAEILSGHVFNSGNIELLILELIFERIEHAAGRRLNDIRTNRLRYGRALDGIIRDVNRELIRGTHIMTAVDSALFRAERVDSSLFNDLSRIERESIRRDTRNRENRTVFINRLLERTRRVAP